LRFSVPITTGLANIISHANHNFPSHSLFNY
jgi:hypothetical protein